MKKIIFNYSILCLLVASAYVSKPGKPPTTRWTLDKLHSTVRFSVSHMVVSEGEGAFKLFDGSMEHSKEDFSDAKIVFSIDVNSINTDNDKRDSHLKGEDFFSADKFPKITFESTSFTPKGNNNYKLAGNLTVRDVTKPVTFDVTYGGTIKTQRGAKCGFKATTTINRLDYNLRWNKTLEAGGLALGHDVTITVKVEMDEVK
jgi:polyisoprenoid-binding protein YceI